MLDDSNAPADVRRMTLSEWFEFFNPDIENIADELYGKQFLPPSSYMLDPKETELKWVVEGLLPETYLAIIAAASNAGKSCLVTALAVAVARGEPFLGMKTCGKAVLWVALEESRQERNLALQAYGPLPENFLITHEKLLIDCTAGIDPLTYWIKKTKAKLIVIDPLYAACMAESLSDGRTA